MYSIYKIFISVCVAVLICSNATADLIATFEGTITGGTYNDKSVNGETLTVTFTIGDNATVNCADDCSGNSVFRMSDPEIQNSISISGPNGGTFSVDVFYDWDFIVFRDRVVWFGDEVSIILGNVNSYHFRSLGPEIFGPDDFNFTGNVAGVSSAVQLNTFSMWTPGFNATTIEGDGNVLYLFASGLSNLSGSLTSSGSEDSDGDGVPDDQDICPGYDDFADADGDGLPDGCDDCPLDPENDSDGDGVCGDVDAFPNDPNEDTDSDGDGVGDNSDVNNHSDTSPTVSIGGVDSGVENYVDVNGFTLADQINTYSADCEDGVKNHGQFVRCMTQAVVPVYSYTAILRGFRS